MKKLTLLLLIAALLAFSGCGSDKDPVDTKDPNRVEAPDDPDTEKRPTTTETETDETTKTPVTSTPVSGNITSALVTDNATSGSSAMTSGSIPTTSSPATPTTSGKTTGTTATTQTQPTPESYKVEYKINGYRYLLDKDDNLAYVKDGDDPVFNNGTRMKFDDKRVSIYCKKLNKSLLLDKDGNAIGVTNGMLDLPYDDFMIAYKSSDSTDFRLCDAKNGTIISDKVYRGFNERDDGKVSLLVTTKQIEIFDGKEIIDSRTYEAVYYYVTTYALVREDGHLRLYNTNFELLSDFGEIKPTDKMHFDETVFDGEDTFEFFFDSGSYKYEPAPDDKSDETTKPSDTTNPSDTTKSEDTTKPEDTKPADTTEPPVTDTTKPSEPSDTSSDTTKPSDTTNPSDTTKPIDSTDTTGKPTTDGYVIVAESGNLQLIDSNGRYYLKNGKKTLYVDGLTDPLYAEIVSSNVDIICVLGKDLTMSAYLISDSKVEKLNVGLVETAASASGDIIIINGSIRSYVLKDGEPVLACSGGYSIMGNWLLGYDMVTKEASAYTLDCEEIVAPGDAIGLAVLSDGSLLIGEDFSYTIMTPDYKVGYTSSKYDRIFMAVNEHILVNDGGKLRLIDLDESIEAELGDISGWIGLSLDDDESGYDEKELVGTPIYYFTLWGYKNGKYSTIEFTYYPKTGAINKTENIG